jgi:hypothetical protein
LEGIFRLRRGRTALRRLADPDAASPIRMRPMSEFQPAMTMGGRVFFAGVGQGKLTATATATATAAAGS